MMFFVQAGHNSVHYHHYSEVFEWSLDGTLVYTAPLGLMTSTNETAGTNSFSLITQRVATTVTYTSITPVNEARSFSCKDGNHCQYPILGIINVENPGSLPLGKGQLWTVGWHAETRHHWAINFTMGVSNCSGPGSPRFCVDYRKLNDVTTSRTCTHLIHWIHGQEHSCSLHWTYM